MELKDINDLKVAEFTGVTNRTLQNWKKPKNIEGVKIFSTYGKHNLYRGAKLATYLLALKKNEEETIEEENNLTLMSESIEKIIKIIDILRLECKSKYLEDLKEEAEFLKEKIKDLENLTNLLNN